MIRKLTRSIISLVLKPFRKHSREIEHTKKYILNVKASPKDDRDDIYALKAVAAAELPQNVDLSEWNPSVKDQGTIGSCGSHAFASLTEHLAKKDSISWNDMPLSELFHYYVVRQDAYGGQYPEDSGQFLRDGAKVCKNVGITPEQLWPYKTSKYNDDPARIAFWFSGLWRLKSYNRVYSVEGMKTALAQEKPVAFGMFVYDTIFNTPRSGDVPHTGRNAGGHALLACGYDDTHPNPDGTTGAILFQNSWGTRWGKSGYGWVSYKLLQKNFLEAWTGTIR